jgi:predicted XRE-type DNA-binding protein
MPQLRVQITRRLVEGNGLSMAEVARQIGVSMSEISKVAGCVVACQTCLNLLTFFLIMLIPFALTWL